MRTSRIVRITGVVDAFPIRTPNGWRAEMDLKLADDAAFRAGGTPRREVFA
jgi:hypothetical protein